MNPSPNSRRLLLCPAIAAALLCLPFSAALGEEAPPAPADKVIAEMENAFSKTGGYIATYRSEGEKKRLECTLAYDEISGLFAIRMSGEKEGERKMEMRQWNTPDDRTFTASDDTLIVMTGIREELASLVALSNALKTQLSGKPQPGESPGWLPWILFHEEGFSVGISTTAPPWKQELKDPVIEGSDEKTVNFRTKESGLVTVERANGLVLRQVLESKRTLERIDLKLNPGSEEVRRISQGWETEGAKDVEVLSKMAPLRLMTFQLAVSSIEEGTGDLGKLGKTLEEQRPLLRRFCAGCINKDKRSLYASKMWKELFAGDKLRAAWLKQTPEANADDQEAYEKFLGSPAFQEGFRKTFVEAFLKPAPAVKKLMEEIFGPGGWEALRTTDETGAAAKEMLGRELARAYLEALVERKMKELLGPRQGLD